ncbi:hypothetical protein OK016_06180 [Vibrio chagasii]|nr:hypothetical protein [Vibrio chagasii]
MGSISTSLKLRPRDMARLRQEAMEYLPELAETLTQLKHPYLTQLARA